MHSLTRLSLSAATEAVRVRALHLLREEYPDESIEMEPCPGGRPHVFLCRVNGRVMGPPLNLEDTVGAVMRRGEDAAVREVAEALSGRIMLHLQTAG